MLKTYLDIHPEVRKFWEDLGHSIKCKNYWIRSNFHQLFYVIDVGAIAFLANPNDSELTYSFRGSLYTEKEILQLLKLKAFL